MARGKKLYLDYGDVSVISELVRKINSIGIKQNEVLEGFNSNNFNLYSYSKRKVSLIFEKLLDDKTGIIEINLENKTIEIDCLIERENDKLEIFISNLNKYDNLFNPFYGYKDMLFMYEIVTPSIFKKDNKKSLESYSSKISRKLSFAERIFDKDLGLLIFSSYLEVGKYKREIISKKIPRVKFIDLGYKLKNLKQRIYYGENEFCNVR